MTSSRTTPWLLSVLAIALFGFALTATGLAGPLRSGGQFLTEPLVAAISRLTSPIADIVGNAGSYGEILDENRDLRLENERLRQDLARLREERARAVDADELLNLRNDRRNETFAL